MLDPRRVLTFREVAVRGSFSRAAEALSLTQSAVSQQVAALERELGTRLLDRRGPGGLSRTPAGERLLEHAGALADRLALADAQLAELIGVERRELRVGAFPSALATIVPDAARRLLDAQPGLDVSLREGRLDELPGAVRDGRLHVALGFQDAAAPRREHPGTRRSELLEEPMIAALPPRHRLARRRTIRLADLSRDTWTAPSRDGLIHRACVAAGFVPRIALICVDPLATRAVVAAGLAVTLTPRLLAPHLHGVRTVPVEGDPARRSLYALLPDAGARPLDRAFVAELEAVVAAA
jgi:DNA-binding transcriptional LysR family regulator